tara:strand:+ start:855 stop:1235 length:381 start_codon:yes stop_codon:yes gene_type:complete
MTYSLFLENPQCLPPGISVILSTIALLLVSVNPTARAKALTVRPTNHIWIYRKNNLFTNCIAQINLSALSIKVNPIILFRTLFVSGNKHQCEFVFHRTPHWLKTTLAFLFEPSVEVTPNYNLSGTR